MHKAGSNPDHLEMSDVLCDFCHGEWTHERPMVEGHQGGCICGVCLAQAYRQVEIASLNAAETGKRCTLCLEERDDAIWQSPLWDDARACRRCVRQSAAVLQKDPDSGWRKPEA